MESNQSAEMQTQQFKAPEVEENISAWTGVSKGKTKYAFWAMCFVLVMSVAFLTLGSFAQSTNIMLGVLYTEFVLLLCGTAIFLALTNQHNDWKRVLRIRPAKFSVYVKVFLMSFCLLPVAAFMNVTAMWVISQFGTLRLPDFPAADSPVSYLYSLFCIAVSAGICEEIMFRGAVMGTLEKQVGRRTSAVLAALLFGVFHYNLGNLLSPIVLGIVFAYVAQVTDSIFPAIFGHFMNNGIAVTIDYLRLLGADEPINPEIAEQLGDVISGVPTSEQLLSLMGILAVIAAVTGYFVFLLLRSIKRSYPKRESELYATPIDEKYNYLGTEYQIWKRQPGKVGYLSIAVLVLILIAYAMLNYRVFFA